MALSAHWRSNHQHLRRFWLNPVARGMTDPTSPVFPSGRFKRTDSEATVATAQISQRNSPSLKHRCRRLIDKNQLGLAVEQRYPATKPQHLIQSERPCTTTPSAFKQPHMRSSDPVSKVFYDTRMHVIRQRPGPSPVVSASGQASSSQEPKSKSRHTQNPA